MKTNEKRSDYYLNRFTDFVIILKKDGNGLYSDFRGMFLYDYFGDNAEQKIYDRRDCEKLRGKLHSLAYDKKIMKVEHIIGDYKKLVYVQNKKGIRY